MEDLRVLIVDDLETARKILRAQLRSMGFKHIHEATNGLEALRVLERQGNAAKIMERNIKLILCDINMPEMDGIKFLGEIRGREEFGDIAGVFITGENTKETVIKALKLFAAGYIIKPYTQEVFLDKITQILEKKELLK